MRSDNILKHGLSLMMDALEQDEIDFWAGAIKRYAERGDKVVEMGCGSGRIVKLLARAGFHICGFDNDRLFIGYCKKQNLDVFYLDAIKAVPKNQMGRYKIAGITSNTLLNFPKKARNKWISCAHSLLRDKGILLVTVYSDTRFSRHTIDERVKFYRNVLAPSNGAHVEFFDNKKRAGIHLCNKKGKELWFSEWLSKNELQREINSWTGLKLVSAKLLKCGFAWGLALKKI